MVGSEVKYADRTHRYSDGYGLQYYKGYTLTDYPSSSRFLKAVITTLESPIPTTAL